MQNKVHNSDVSEWWRTFRSWRCVNGWATAEDRPPLAGRGPLSALILNVHLVVTYTKMSMKDVSKRITRVLESHGIQARHTHDERLAYYVKLSVAVYDCLFRDSFRLDYINNAILCVKCQEHLLKDQLVGVLLHRSLESPRWWRHRWVHFECMVSPELTKNIDYFDLVHKSTYSGKAFLFLLELGLPYDLAWPIAAAAYWLL